jgi:thioredoxin-related protein
MIWCAYYKTAPHETPHCARNLAGQLRGSGTTGEPLVLLVSLPGCPWCELLRRNYLAPMRAEGLPAFQITVNDRKRPVANFQGVSSHGADIAQVYQAKLTPTVMFLNAQGVEIAPRIAGVASADLVGAQLDNALVTARQQLRKDKAGA